jgi:hypothetical protein
MWQCILMVATLAALVLQTFRGFKNKDTKTKIGEFIIFCVGVLAIIATFCIQTKENDSQINDNRDLQKRFNQLDSNNIVLSSELRLRNYDLKTIKCQNDSLKIELSNMGKKQNTVIEVTQKSTQEISKSREAIESANKQTVRYISKSERIKMINELNKYKSNKINLYSVQDREAIKFKSLIKEIFEAAGWKVFDGGIFNISIPMESIQIYVGNLQKAPIRVNAIIKAINIIRMEPKIGTFEIDSDDIMLVIGSKKI